MQLDHVEKVFFLVFLGGGGGGGGGGVVREVGFGQNICYNVAALVNPFNLICNNMTTF